MVNGERGYTVSTEGQLLKPENTMQIKTVFLLLLNSLPTDHSPFITNH